MPLNPKYPRGGSETSCRPRTPRREGLNPGPHPASVRTRGCLGIRGIHASVTKAIASTRRLSRTVTYSPSLRPPEPANAPEPEVPARRRRNLLSSAHPAPRRAEPRTAARVSPNSWMPRNPMHPRAVAAEPLAVRASRAAKGEARASTRARLNLWMPRNPMHPRTAAARPLAVRASRAARGEAGGRSPRQFELADASESEVSARRRRDHLSSTPPAPRQVKPWVATRVSANSWMPRKPRYPLACRERLGQASRDPADYAGAQRAPAGRGGRGHAAGSTVVTRAKQGGRR